MARVWTNNSGLELNAANMNAIETDLAAALYKFRANYTYTAGTMIVTPAGNLVTADANFTSTSTYNAANWSEVSAVEIMENRVTAIEGAATTLTARVLATENKNTTQDNRLTSLETAVPSGGGGSTIIYSGSSADAITRPLIGARVGAGSINTIPDSEYFNELHSLETAMKAEADITNWYRGVGTSSAADFTATVKPELAARPNLKVCYVLEMAVSNAQFNRDFAAQDGIYPHLVNTLNAIKNSGYADRVYLAPFHEGNGGGGAAGDIGSYKWHMYDTDLGQLYTPSSSSNWNTGTPYGSSFRQNTPAQYKTAFRNVVNLVRSLGLPSKIIQWFLAANTSDATLVDGIDRMDMTPGYAGDEYVDIIGLSYYNRSGDLRYSDTWPQPGANGLREFYNSFERMTGNPLWICETGCAESNAYGDKGQWYSDLIKLVASDELPRIHGMIMFMQDSRRYEGVGGAVSQGMNMKLETTAQKQMVGRAINAAKRPTKVNIVPQLGRNILPISASDLTSVDGWVSSVGVTLAVGNQYTPDLDSSVNGLRVTKPAFVTGDDRTSHNIYRRMSKSNIDYVPNDPYVLTFTARASYDGFKIEAGIRQDGGTATTLGDELVLTTVHEQYVVPFASQTDDPLLTGWRIPNFNFGNNTNGASAWFEISNLRLTRGTSPAAGVERLLRPKVRALTNAANLTWNCEASNIYTVTLTQNVTLMAPTGVPYDGQVARLRITQDATGGWTVNLHSSFYSSTPLANIAIGPGAKSLLIFEYDGDGGRWGLIGTGIWDLA